MTRSHHNRRPGASPSPTSDVARNLEPVDLAGAIEACSDEHVRAVIFAETHGAAHCRVYVRPLPPALGPPTPRRQAHLRSRRRLCLARRTAAVGYYRSNSSLRDETRSVVRS